MMSEASAHSLCSGVSFSLGGRLTTTTTDGGDFVHVGRIDSYGALLQMRLLYTYVLNVPFVGLAQWIRRLTTNQEIRGKKAKPGFVPPATRERDSDSGPYGQCGTPPLPPRCTRGST